MIEVKNLSKRYGAHVALDNVSFSVEEGEIVGLLGPNGAGKSTAMNIITGYISASRGTVTVGGADIAADPIAVKKKIGYLPENPPLYTEMKVAEYLNFVCELKLGQVKGNLEKSKRAERIGEIMESVGISDVSNRLINNLSKGYRQRVGLAAAMVGEPEVLILDEPTVGLDPNQIVDVRNVIKSLGKKHTVILSTHILQEVSAICDRIIIIHLGKIAADLKLSELGGNNLEEIFIRATAGIMFGDDTAGIAGQARNDAVVADGINNEKEARKI